MTGPCSGATTGVAKSGLSALTYIGPGAIGGALAGLSGWAGAAVGAAIGSLTYDLTTFCPSGPPAMPTFTTADIVALLAPIPTPARSTAAGKFSDFLGNVFWSQLCDCSGGGTSTLGALSAYPAGAPQQLNKYPNGTPCFDSAVFTDTGVGAGTFTVGGLPVPAGLFPTAYVVILTSTITSGAGWSENFTAQAKHGPTVDGTVTVNVPAGATVTLVLPFNPTLSTSTLLTRTGVSGSGSVSIGKQEQFYCGGSPTLPDSPCCPPDPIMQSQIQAILDLVTLIQRQAVPFGYITSTAHATLSGAGAISISGLIGVKVSITTLPTSYGIEGTSPPEHFDLGFITFGCADGFPSSVRLTRNPQIITPARCGLYTDLDYDLSPGVVVTITELLREP